MVTRTLLDVKFIRTLLVLLLNPLNYLIGHLSIQPCQKGLVFTLDKLRNLKPMIASFVTSYLRRKYYLFAWV
jgi:hypothetical protein